MRPDARRCAVAFAGALTLGTALCQPPDQHDCRPRPAASATNTSKNTVQATPASTTQNVACGNMTLSVEAPPWVAPPASVASSADKNDATAPGSKAEEQLRRLGLYGASGLLVLAVLLMLGAFVMAFLRHGIAVNRDNIRFGGAGRGLEISPAFAALVASAIVAGMALVLAMQALDSGADAPKANAARSKEKPG